MASNKDGLVIRLSRDHKINQDVIQKIVTATLDNIINTLAENRRCELRNFAVLEVRTCKARKGRNPRTGESIVIPAKNKVVFKPGKIMRDRISKL